MTEEELTNFRKKLEETMSFPSVYMFKFIIESGHRNLALVENLFEAGTDILTKESRHGKYISVTAKQVVIDAEEIIQVYRRALQIKGVMFL
jgi:uncharacterized protein